jgi:hypothetical protein
VPMDASAIEQARLAAQAQAEAHWEAEYKFWRRLISEEVERNRFNQGFEPVSIDLYPSEQKAAGFLGETQIGRRTFRAIGRWAFDSEGKRIVKLQLVPKP